MVSCAQDLCPAKQGSTAGCLVFAPCAQCPMQNLKGPLQPHWTLRAAGFRPKPGGDETPPKPSPKGGY